MLHYNVLGYVFLGDVVHKFNASSQYVAPLMADFKTHNDTVIAYVDTGMVWIDYR